MKENLIIITEQDSVYVYYLGIDPESLEAVFREEILLCDLTEPEKHLMDMCREYGYKSYKLFEF